MIRYVDRKHTDCSKWDNLGAMFGREDLQAMWVADMDFRCPDCVIEAIRQYADFGVFGYYKPHESYVQAFLDWEETHHGYRVQRDWVRFAPGVVPAVNWLLQILTEPDEAVIVQTPVYYPFLDAVRNNGRTLVCSDLIDTDGVYTVDFEDFERKITEHGVKLFILSSPHNPVGRVWTPDELRLMLEICRRHGVYVLSDEIHHDLTFDGAVHVPTLSVAKETDRIIMLTAASKTFNIAALKNSFVVIKDPELRDAWDRFVTGLRIGWGNPLGYIACEAAYRYGSPWLSEVKEVIWNNYKYIWDEFSAHLPEVRMTPLEATYLAWADFSAYLAPEEVQPFMQDKCHLAFDYGSWFGGNKSGSFIRINLATSRENIEEAVGRIVSALI